MDNYAFDFLRCEDEPIHIPSKIQPFGYFFAVEGARMHILAASDNINELGLNTQNVYKKDIRVLFPRLAGVLEDFTMRAEPKGREVYFDIIFKELGNKTFDLFLSSLNDQIIIEFISKNLQQECTRDKKYKKAVSSFIQSPDLEGLYEKVARHIKSITGYDRVMLYKFDKDYNGEVISEAKEPWLDSYLNLHYPASDIPSQARDLYLINPIRIIHAVSYEPVSIQSIATDPVDMSLSFLRSVSPIHLQYMQNMGVYASMTVSIIVNNRLWGLIACHHHEAFFPNLKTTKVCQDLADNVSSLIDTYQQKEYESAKSWFMATIDTIISVLKQKLSAEDTTGFISENLSMFTSLFHADGVIFVHEGSIESHGIELHKKQLAAMTEAVTRLGFEKSFQTDSLALHCELDEAILKECAGIVCLKMPVLHDAYMIFTKTEQIRNINWGGDPSKSGQSLNPRESFQKFSQVVTKKSHPWQEYTNKHLEILYEKFSDLFLQHSSYKTLRKKEEQIASLQKQKIQNYNQLIDMLVNMIEQRDAYTAGHTQRVAYLCKLIASEMGFTQEEVALIEEAAKLHDIGKISIPDSVLLKPGRLNENEYHLIKQHLDVGYMILNQIDLYQPIAQIMAHHHEKYDGSGYPEGKKEDEIPLSGHIMIVADALDAMTTNRIYQRRKSLQEAVEEIEALKGVWYHPDVVDTLSRLYKQGLKLPSSTSQVPLTSMEYERFSYFFKDALTSFFNESYLWLILHETLPNKKYDQYVLIETKGVTRYNKAHGWQMGSRLLKDVAAHIRKHAEFGEFFRVFGDDFVIGFETENGRDKFLADWTDYRIESVHTEITTLQKESVIAALHTMW